MAGFATPAFCAQGSKEANAEGVTLAGLLKFIEQFGNQPVPVAIAIKEIEIHGLRFRPSAEDVERLGNAGATKDLLEAIQSARMPPPSLPPAVKREGRLLVSCTPVDCDVLIDGRAISAHNEMKPITLPEGTVTVSATKRSYITGRPQQRVEILPDQLARVEFHFEVDPEALRKRGWELFQKMVAVTGLGPSYEGMLKCVGGLQVHDPDQHPVTWGLTVMLGDGERKTFELKRGRQRYVISRNGNKYKWSKRPRTKEAAQLEEAIRLLLDYEYSSVLRVLAVKPTLVAAGALFESGNENVTVRVESQSRSYLIHLDSESRPTQIHFESAGLNKGLKVLFSDFRREPFGLYPRRTQIVLPGAERQGIEVGFEKLEVVTNDKKARVLKTAYLR